MFEVILFWLLAIGAVGASLMVILPPVSRNPLSAALSLIISFFFMAGLYVLLLAHLMAVLQVLVYAGAIMILFMFVIMLLNLSDDELGKQNTTIAQLVGAASALFIALKVVMVTGASGGGFLPGGQPQDMTVAEMADFGSVGAVGDLLFRQFLFPFELTSILLLVAVIGAVVLAKRTL